MQQIDAVYGLLFWKKNQQPFLREFPRFSESDLECLLFRSQCLLFRFEYLLSDARKQFTMNRNDLFRRRCYLLCQGFFGYDSVKKAMWHLYL